MSPPDLKFGIGDRIFVASWITTESWVTCPDCRGSGRLRVIMGDDTEVSIECESCRRGYNPSSGRIPVYCRAARAESAIVNGVHAEIDETRYYTSAGIANPEDVFGDEPTALARAQEKAAAADAEERERIAKKEKPARSWAWNAHYHRQCIRDAQRQIEYHTSKLNVAAIKAKEVKAGTAIEATE